MTTIQGLTLVLVHWLYLGTDPWPVLVHNYYNCNKSDSLNVKLLVILLKLSRKAS